jgi:hypothetical protein
MDIELWRKVDDFVRSGQTKAAVCFLEQGLSGCASTRFKALIGCGFSNNPKALAEEVNRFIRKCETSFPVKAVYLEMNGFDINPDRWYFDFFAYSSYTADSPDLDWLAEWDSMDWPDVTLNGLEKVQEDFGWYTGQETKGYKDTDARVAADFANLLVMCKFASLIEDAAGSGIIDKTVPILATAHDFDIVARFAT